jgi:hypothetical protein
MKRGTLSVKLYLSLMLLVLLLFNGCHDFLLSELLDGEGGLEGLKSPLTLGPASVTLTVNSTLTFAASGGSPPYIFSVVSGSGTINATTGEYTAPVSASTDIVQVTDSKGATATSTVTITATGALTIIPSNITVAVNNGLTFMATGGIPPYTFSLTATGSGSPTINVPTPGVYVAGGSPGTDTVQVQDSDVPPNIDTATVTVTNVATNVDYDITAINIPANALAGTAVSSTDFDIQNIGSADGSQTVNWKLYASTNTTLGAGDEMLTSGATGALASSGTSNINVTTGSWPTAAGSYYLIVEVSAADDLTTANNIQTSAGQVNITLPDVDYQIVGVNNLGGTSAGGAISGNFNFENIGADNGSQVVTWEAYVSTNTSIDVGDTLIDSNTTGQLNGGQTSALIPFTGTWPSAPGNYYLIVRVTAGDDTAPGNNYDDSGSIAISAPTDIDYTVTVVNNTGGTTAGQPLSGNFTFQNIGTDNGSQTVGWEAYVSTDDTLDMGDAFIDSGTNGPLAAGTPAGPIGFNGVWPATPDDYYLIVKVFASDDINPANDAQDSGAVTVSPGPAPDYTISVLNHPIKGYEGAALNPPHNFTIQEVAVVAGSQDIDWEVYASTDQNLDGGDTLLDSGTESALGAGGSVAVTYSGSWPAGMGNFYYIVVKIEAADDGNDVNDTAVSSMIPVADTIFTESEPNDGVPPPPATGNYDNLGTLNAGQLVEISGAMDAFDEYDTFRLDTAVSTEVEVVVYWNTGFDDIDLHFWRNIAFGGLFVATQGNNLNIEPATPPWIVVGLNPGSEYCVGVYFWLAGNTSGSTGQSYTLYVRAVP